MSTRWVKIKARKDHTCESCGDGVVAGETYWVKTDYEGVGKYRRYPQETSHCVECGDLLSQKPVSFNECRKHKLETGGYRCDRCRQKSMELTEFHDEDGEKLFCRQCYTNKTEKGKLPIITCVECNEEILIVPDVKEMAKAIMEHARKHPTKAIIIRDSLTVSMLTKISETQKNEFYKLRQERGE